MTSDESCKCNKGIALVMVTTGGYDEARRIALTLVEEKLVACVNIIPTMYSLYRWKGVIEEERECLLLAKTIWDMVDAVINRVKALHSYEVPCIEVVNVVDGLDDYFDYVLKETQKKG
jgi:periplasmic divalent cation tolerance protein